MKESCEKCGKSLECIVIPSHQGHYTSRIAGKSFTRKFTVPQKVRFIEKHKCLRKEYHLEQIKRLKERGLPLLIEG